jgi:hypothetical protein
MALFGGSPFEEPLNFGGGDTSGLGFDPKWLTLIGMAGKMGQKMLAGTDKQWKGDIGGVAADVATNTQAGAANQNQKQMLQDLVKQLSNPYTAGVSGSMKPDGSLSFNAKSISPQDQTALDMVSSFKDAYGAQGAMSPTSQVPQGESPAPNPQLQQLSSMLGGSRPFV